MLIGLASIDATLVTRLRRYGRTLDHSTRSAGSIVAVDKASFWRYLQVGPR
jgi:hypothetical protein